MFFFITDAVSYNSIYGHGIPNSYDVFKKSQYLVVFLPTNDKIVYLFIFMYLFMHFSGKEEGRNSVFFAINLKFRIVFYAILSLIFPQLK